MSSVSKINQPKIFSDFIATLKLISNPNSSAEKSANGSSSSMTSGVNIEINNTININSNDKVANDMKIENKSKFKTIKIFVASNKNEFAHETECLLQEAQPELQQYFMQFGYDFLFVDVNLNYEFDPFMDPFLFECMCKEVKEASQLSEACFFLVSFEIKINFFFL